MREDRVEFFSEGTKVVGILRQPDDDGPHAGIVQGPGWLGLMDSKLYVPYHQAFTDAGFAVLIIDYRGFGDSEGERGRLSPQLQLEDLINAVTYLQTRADIDSDRIGVFSSGGTGGGNAVMLAAHDTRVRCAVSQVPVADGEDWLRRMRREYEWQAFLERLDEDRRKRVVTGHGEMVHPREEIMVPTPERRQTKVKTDVDDRVPSSVPLATAEAIMAYKPVDVAHKVRNLLVVAVEGDAVTPTDHAVRLYEAASEPKKLILQRHTTHYAAYAQYQDVVIPEMVSWLSTNLVGRAVEGVTPSGIEILQEDQ